MRSKMRIVLALCAVGGGIVCSAPWVDSKENDTQTVKLKRYSCIDKQGIGIEAFSMLMPSDWNFKDRKSVV